MKRKKININPSWFVDILSYHENNKGELICLRNDGGNGYDYSSKKGIFEVKFSEDKTKKFKSLSNARKFYDSLLESKAIWDITGVFAELLEAHTLVEMENERAD